MTTSCAVPVLHSSAVLYNQIPWYLPRLQDNAVKGKNFAWKPRCQWTLLCSNHYNVSKTERVGFFKLVISFRAAVKHVQSCQYAL